MLRIWERSSEIGSHCETVDRVTSSEMASPIVSKAGHLMPREPQKSSSLPCERFVESASTSSRSLRIDCYASMGAPITEAPSKLHFCAVDSTTRKVPPSELNSIWPMMPSASSAQRRLPEPHATWRQQLRPDRQGRVHRGLRQLRHLRVWISRELRKSRLQRPYQLLCSGQIELKGLAHAATFAVHGAKG